MKNNPINTESHGDGVFKVRRGNKGEHLIQFPVIASGEYRRFTEDNGERVYFQKV